MIIHFFSDANDDWHGKVLLVIITNNSSTPLPRPMAHLVKLFTSSFIIYFWHAKIYKLNLSLNTLLEQ